MIKNNKLKTLISSILILLPMLVAFVAEEVSTPVIPGALMILKIVSPVMLVVHIGLLMLTSLDKRSVEQGEKITSVIFYMIPFIIIVMAGFTLAVSYGFEFDIKAIVSVCLGGMFILIGNYIPKAKRNRFFGYKITWTLKSDENWNATHRFAGKTWVVIGVLSLLCAFVPDALGMVISMVLLLVATILPLIFSYIFYKKQIKEGTLQEDNYETSAEFKFDKKSSVIASSVAVILVLAVVILMFVGKLSFVFGEESLEIGTTFGAGMEIKYSDIDSVRLAEDGVDGIRVGGFASSTLLFGMFKNDEFGVYTRYTYTKCDSAVVIISRGEEIVISDADDESTKALYEMILQRIDSSN